MELCGKDGLKPDSTGHEQRPRIKSFASLQSADLPVSADDEPLLETLGEHRVEQMVELFYNYNLRDEVTRGFFQGVNIERLQRMQTRFLVHILGGHPMNTGKMRSAHKRLLDLGDVHFDAFLANIHRACHELKFAPKVTHRIMTSAEATRADVLGKNPYLKLKSSRQCLKDHESTVSR
ncbi:globin-like protein [Basidiobolus meristosporus CBS 931.73]|uniref:Globin-like protein n=1 Tax=Basidiobolus meristosporus CBS 931.73 TaxID=1314790 RepID=A0A1Y1XTD9_9FUNG|nr:globin-like protein [Basidiobolus meristosporus CBS 931.73]|eukprot:ORX88998.1 globin-like protein [Basidiobolus meristosporus CBS 931.73]